MPDFSYLERIKESIPVRPLRPPPATRFWLLALIILVYCGLFELVNAAAILFITARGAVTPGAFCVGAIGAEAALVAIYWVFGGGAVWQRTILVAYLGGMFALTFIYGWAGCQAMMHFPSRWTPNEAPEILRCLPLILITMSCPLWMYRAFFKLRIVHPQWNSAKPQEGWVPALAAVISLLIILALVFFARDEANAPGQRIPQRILGPASVTIATTTLAIVPIILWGTFRGQAKIWRVAMPFWIFFVGLVLISLFSGLAGSWPDRKSWDFLFGVGLAFSASLIVPLWTFRRFGFQLRWGNDSQAANASDAG